MARLVPVFMPDILFRLTGDGQPVFKEFAAAIRPTEFEPGKVFGSGKMKPIDYMLDMAEGRIPPPSNLDLATVQHQAPQTAFRFHINQYLSRRAADWKAKGFTETLIDFTELNKRSKFWGDDQRASWLNWDEVADLRNPLGERQNITERIMLRELLRRVDMMVMLENRLDVLVQAAHALAARQNRRSRAGVPQQPYDGVAERTECRAHRSTDTGGLRDHGL